MTPSNTPAQDIERDENDLPIEGTVPHEEVPLPEDKKHWIVRQSTIRLYWIVGGVVLAALTLTDIFLERKVFFGIDGTFGFYSWYGLLTCAAMVVGAKWLGNVLKRKDTYYDE